MKVRLMFPDKDFNIIEIPQAAKRTANKDLELEFITEAAARNDKVIYDSFFSALYDPLEDSGIIGYRQEIIKDCIENPEVIRHLYSLACEAEEMKRKSWWGFYQETASAKLSNSVSLLNMFIGTLRELRKTAESGIGNFNSKGFKKLFSVIQKELNEDYLKTLTECLEDLKFRNGMNIAVRFGSYNQGTDYFLIEPSGTRKKWFSISHPNTFVIHERDEAGHSDLYRRKELALMSAVIPVYRSALHVHAFFVSLQRELAFYAGCINLYETLIEKGRNICFPSAAASPGNNFCFKNLSDMSMALTGISEVIGNTLDLTGKNAVIITGANQGGKTTFLRSIGQAQIMLCCGLFVTADKYISVLTKGVYSHFKKEEDKSLESGKLTEEMERMSDIAERIKP
ncbi:MAG: hypothetical protein PHO18_02590, partial [Synergistaceae bacterium]|nr:hypothetical protein [Synergistaceae bacterium]